MKKRKKVLLIFLIVLLILSIPFLSIGYFGSQTGQLHKAKHFFKNNQPALEDSIDVLESTLQNTLTEDPVNNKENYIELKKPPTLPSDVNTIYWVRAGGDDQAYVLSLGAFGIVPSMSYYGLYYSINDTPCNLMETQAPENVKQQENTLKPSDSEIWTWQESKGDNSFYTERIAPHWFTYRQTF
ncbi:MAG: hypothetical protein PHZ03_00325 [Syntrophomonas sp.]|nr:hypothetical protein [Syntrophomonas sp.]